MDSGGTAPLLCCSARQLELLRTARRGPLVVTFTLRDTRGSAVRTRRLGVV